jgi:aldose sugar dehydrogenase
VGKSSVLFLALAGVTIPVACMKAPGGSAESTTAKAVVLPASIQQSRTNIPKLYQEACAKCHGGQGEGGGGGTRTLLTKDLYDQKHDKPFYDAIAKGVPDMGMEAYGETLTPGEMWGLVVYIRELQTDWMRQQTGSRNEENKVYTSGGERYKIERLITSGLRTPWAIDWLPDGRMLITNRPGDLAIANNQRVIATVEGIPKATEIGQGGLMDVTVHPNYKSNGWIYLSYTEPDGDNMRRGMTKIVRGKLSGNRWVTQQTIWEAPRESYNGSGVHFGNRIVFDGKGHIFFSVGERGAQALAQDLTKANGKVYRVNEDGSIPKDNPFVDDESKSKGYLPSIWSYGHRNPQGLAFDRDGNLWDTEHGPRGGDELNRVVKGANYGWPVVSFSIEYNGAPRSTPWPASGEKFKMPTYRWIKSIGACGMDTGRGDAFPKWRGDLFAGGLSGANVDRIRVAGDRLVERDEILHGMGRVREVAVSPKGEIYVALNGPDHILRIVPAK